MCTFSTIIPSFRLSCLKPKFDQVKTEDVERGAELSFSGPHHRQTDRRMDGQMQ